MSTINNQTKGLFAIDQNEPLFSELTPTEAAVVEGGIRLKIVRIQAIRAATDNSGPDDTYITVNGAKIWGNFSMMTGQSRTVNKTLRPSGSSARVELFDDDPGSGDDSMGGFTASNTSGVLTRVRVSGGGSTYDVFYRGYAA